MSIELMRTAQDEYLFGWDHTPGIVSVWASRDGRALVWRRLEDRVTCTQESFRPWLFAATLDDLSHLENKLVASDTALSQNGTGTTYRELAGPAGSYRYLLSAADGRVLERELVRGATRRLDRQVSSINDLPEDYYRVGVQRQ